jgi:hypothetical protein
MLNFNLRVPEHLGTFYANIKNTHLELKNNVKNPTIDSTTRIAYDTP